MSYNIDGRANQDEMSDPLLYRKVTLVGILLFACSVSIASGDEISLERLYVSYSVFETYKTETDHRKIILQIFLDGGGHPGYRYREQVIGSTAPTVESIDFFHEYPWDQLKVSHEKQAELQRKLLAMKIFDVTTEPKGDPDNFFSSFDVRIADREMRYYFYSPPLSTERKALHDIMLSFARDLGIDKPKDPTRAVTVTEGDLELARKVFLADLLSDPDKYHGKRISVIGFYHREFESDGLYVGEEAFRSRRFDRQGIWRGAPSSFASQTALKDKNDSWLRVEGVFLKGPSGHRGAWPGEIDRLTRIEPISPSRP
jgi:hypothetical protein